MRVSNISYHIKQKTLFTVTCNVSYSSSVLVIFFLYIGVGFELNSDEYRYVGIQIHYARPLQGKFFYVANLPT